jgi:hypothetical protein
MVCGCELASYSGPVWTPGDNAKPAPSDSDGAATLFRPDILVHIDKTIKALGGDLRDLSLDIHSWFLWQASARLTQSLMHATRSS